MPTTIPGKTSDDALLALRPTATFESSSGIRAHWDERIKAAALFSARTTQEKYVDFLRKTLATVASGNVTPQVAETKLRTALQEIGYRPETGFPDDRTGLIPPATPGSIRDLSSTRRIQLILDTNVKQARSLGQIAASENPTVLLTDPAWQLTRTGMRKKPRGDWKARWKAAGDACGWVGASKTKFIALKTSPIWQKIADGTGGFTDTLGSPYPPFAFGSGMAWVNVSRDNWIALCRREGIPDGMAEIIDKVRQIKMARSPETALKAPVSRAVPKSTDKPSESTRRDVRPPDAVSAPRPSSADAQAAQEAKKKAVRGLSEVRGVLADISRAIDRLYRPTAERTLQKIRDLKNLDPNEEPIPDDSELTEVTAALADYRRQIDTLQEYDQALAKMARTVETADMKAADATAFADRMYRFLSAAGRYEDRALDLNRAAKSANLRVKDALKRAQADAS